MEKYLKMSDVFNRGVLHNDGSTFIRDSCASDIAWFNYDAIDDKTQAAKYAAHAINSHDELVAMNKALLAVVNNFRITEPDEDGCVWLVLNGNGTTGMAMFNLGNGDRIAAKVALHLESYRKSAIQKAKAAA